MSDNNDERHENEEPVIRDKRRIDPETGDVREPDAAAVGDDTPAAEAVDADGADAAEELSDADQALLDQAAQDLVAEMRSDMLRAQAELVNFRTRVERDRAANREAVSAPRTPNAAERTAGFAIAIDWSGIVK